MKAVADMIAAIQPSILACEQRTGIDEPAIPPSGAQGLERRVGGRPVLSSEPAVLEFGHLCYQGFDVPCRSWV